MECFLVHFLDHAFLDAMCVMGRRTAMMVQMKLRNYVVILQIQFLSQSFSNKCYVIHLGEAPCDGKLHCEDGRCISKRYCCDRYLDPNCTATYEIPCCKVNFLPPDFPMHTHQSFNEIGFLQSTMYTIIGM
jgi:hypothetical protein